MKLKKLIKVLAEQELILYRYDKVGWLHFHQGSKESFSKKELESVVQKVMVGNETEFHLLVVFTQDK